MFFTIQSHDEKSLEKIYNRLVRELNVFFDLNLEKNKPKIFLVKDRKSINKLIGEKTQDWVVGWVDNSNVFVLDKENFERESCHKYSEKGYSNLIKHELVHVLTQFFSGILNMSIKPDWLWEGLAIYLSNQNRNKKKPNQLKEFIKFYSQNNKSSKVYKESGFAVEFLVKNFGRQKLLNLIKSLKNINSEKAFAKKFKEIYGFRLSYKNFNNF